MSSKPQLKFTDKRSLPEIRNHGFAVRFVCGETSVAGEEKKYISFVCMHSRNLL